MLETELALRSAWADVLGELGVSEDDAVVLGGPLAERFGAAVPFAVVDEISGLVSLGAGPVLPNEATVVSSGLDDASLDAVVLVEAWRSHDELDAVVTEGRRVTRAGGRVFLAELDGERLIHATPAMRSSALFYRAFGERSGVMGASSERFPSIDLALLRSGLTAIERWPLDIPVAAFDDAESYLDAVANGMWPGVDALSAEEWKALSAEVHRAITSIEPPIVEYQPWLLASGVRPG